MKTLPAGELRLADYVRPGDGVVWGQVCGEPQTLTEALMAQRAEIGTFSVFLGATFSRTVRPEHADQVQVRSFGAIGSLRKLAQASVLEVVPTHISQMERSIRDGRIVCDVALVQVSPANARGEHSLGLISDYVRAMVKKARVVIAEINAQVPWIPCDDPLTADDIDVAVETDRPLIEVPPAPIADMDMKIAGFAEGFIPDRATLQVGIGGVPEAIMTYLRSRRDLGIHSGMIGDSVVDPVEAGAVTNAHKEIDPGVTVTGALLGTRRLYDFCADNPALRMTPIAYTHNGANLARLSNFISMNSALEVDLTGQVNAEAIGTDYVGAVGGQVDYVRAANNSEGGRSLIALRSTAKGGEMSRVVDRLSGPVTTARADVDVIITEHGAAELRGLSLRERIAAMIEIADPAFREDLARRGHALVKQRD